MDPLAHHWDEHANIRIGKACLVYVPGKIDRQKTGRDQRFQKRLFAIDRPCRHYLFTYRACQFIDCIVAWSKLHVITFYWQGQHKTFVAYYRGGLRSCFVFDHCSRDQS